MLNRDAQSQRSVSGSEFEKVVAKLLNSFTTASGIVVVRARESDLSTLVDSKVNLKDIMDFTKIPVKRRCDQTQLQDYPDLDLFALVKPISKEREWKLLAILSCKVSFHARHTESAFWGLLVRLTSRTPFVMITEDRDIYSPKSSELGVSCQNSTSTRRLLESFTDRIYLVKRYGGVDDPRLGADIKLKRKMLAENNDRIIFDDPTVKYHTKYCHSVRPIDDLFHDLLRWRSDISQ